VEVTCAYPLLFEPAPWKDRVSRNLGVTDEPPRPLTLAPEEPLVPTKGKPIEVEKGESVAFRLAFVESAVQLLPVVVRALRRSRRTNFGSKARVVTLALQSVSLLSGSEPSLGGTKATLMFLTPLRLKRDGRIQSRIDAKGLLEALLRRAKLLSSIGGKLWVPPFEAEEVLAGLTLAADMQVVPVSRYSNRQKRSMVWPGLVGTVTVEGPALPQIWPLLCWGAGAQIGKATSFGFGRYRLAPQA